MTRHLAKALFCLMFMCPAFAEAGTAIPLTVNLSESVNVTGTPRVAVDVGGTTRYATYTSGSGSNALTFTLSPQAGDVDLDGITVSSPIDLNGGTIKDTSGNDLASLSFTPPNTSGITINYPSLGMDFVYDADGRYTLNGTAYNDLTSFLSASGGSFTRSSTATYYDSAGFLQTASANVPRFDYDPTTHQQKGLLIEGAATNLALQSSAFDQSPWAYNGTSVTANATTAPDGTMTADLVTLTGTSSKSIFQAIATPGTNLVFSIWLKAGSKTSAAIGIYDTTGTLWGNPSSGSTISILSGPGTTAVYLAGGALWHVNGLSTTQWTHVVVTRTTYANRVYVYPNQASQTIGDSVYLWGAQVETGSLATSYIPTGTSTASRSADILEVTTGSWYSSSQGTFQTKAYQASGASSNASTAEIWEDSNNKLSCRTMYNLYTAGGVAQANITMSLATGSFQTQTFAYAVNDFAAYKNGTLMGTDSSGSLFSSPSFMRVGNTDGNASYYYNGWISKLKYYPTRIPNAQLQLLSQ